MIHSRFIGGVFGVLLAFAVVLGAVAEPIRDLPIKPAKHGVYVVAHRGAHMDIPENTLPAYARAIELGVDFVEVDVRATKDGHFISMHNGAIDAYAPGAHGNVCDMTLAQLKALDVGARVAPKWKGTPVPTFEEILDLCKGKCGIYLDLKEAPVAPLVDLIRARGMERDVIWYADPEEIRELEKRSPACVPMPDPGEEKNLAKLLEELTPRVVASSWNFMSPTFAKACHAAQAIVIMDDKGPACWEQAIAWGVDGIQTDQPEQLIAFLKERTTK